MKVGDIVRQGGNIVQFSGPNGKPRLQNKSLGVVVNIEGMFPPEWKDNDYRRTWRKFLGRRIDVLWESGGLSKGFAEGALEVIYE